MSKELINKLSKLKMAERCLRRTLDMKSFTTDGKARIFNQILQIEKEIDLIKFKIRLEKEMKK